MLAAGAWVGLLLIVSSACTTGTGTPASAKPAVVAQQPATTAQQSTGTSQKPAQTSSASSTAPKAQAVDPCTLVTGAEIEAIVGKLRSAQESVKSQTGEVLFCKTLTDQGQLVDLSVIDAVNWDFKLGFNKDNEDSHFQKVSGFGDDAFFISPDHGEDELMILAKPYILEVVLTVDSEKNLDYAKAIAEKALPRLK
jgi:hypothetical protein